MPEQWTIAQAAFVLNEPLEAFRRSVERGPVKPRVVRAGGVNVRVFDLADLVFLHAERDLRSDLTPKGREELYKALTDHLARITRPEVAFGQLRFKITPHLKEVRAKLQELEALSREIDTPDGEPVIKGTRIEVHRLAALLDGGMTMEAVLRDYPSLGEKQVRAAKAYAESHPKAGRPYPKTTAKAAMRGSGLDALDDRG